MRDESLNVRGVAVVSVVMVLLGLSGCKATPPGKIETKAAVFAKHHIFVGNRSAKNPLQDSTDAIDDGKDAFGQYCVACHGMDGQNTGVPFADRLSPPVPSLASPDIQSYSDGQLKWIIDNGIFPSGMPGAKGLLSDDEQWSIVTYLRHLPRAGSQGVPSMYAR